MDELKNSIDKLTERITSLEAGLHVAKESLAAKAKEIEYLKEALEIKEDEINHSGRLLDLIMKLDPAEVSSFNKGLEQSE